MRDYLVTREKKQNGCLIYISRLFLDPLAAASISQYSLRTWALRTPPSFMWLVFTLPTTPKAPRSEVWWWWGGGKQNDTVRAVALHKLSREVCVCVDAFCKACISLPIQKLFLPSFLTSLPLLLLADKKMAVATVVPRNLHCFRRHCWGRLKVMSGGTIRNVGGQQRNRSS